MNRSDRAALHRTPSPTPIKSTWFRRMLPCLGILAAASCSNLFGASVIPVVQGGDAPSRGTGVLSELSSPRMADDGTVTFSANLQEEGLLQAGGLFRKDGASGGVETLILTDDPSPDENGYVSGAFSFQINAAGDMSAVLGMADTLAGQSDAALIATVSRDATAFEIAVRSDQEVSPGGDMVRFFASAMNSRMLNTNGQVAFSGFINNGQTPAIYRADESGFTEIAVVGRESFPSETWTGLSSTPHGIDSSGRVLFSGTSSSSGYGLFLKNESTLTPLVYDNAQIPDGPGQVRLFQSLLAGPAMNDQGQVVFSSTLTGTAGGSADNAGIYRAEESGLTKIARKGESVSDDNGLFLSFGLKQAINNSGTVLFRANISGASDGSDEGLFLSDGSTMTIVARVHDAAPGGGRFLEFDPYSTANNLVNSWGAVNDAGQVAFLAWVDLENGGSVFDQIGLFHFDPDRGLTSIFREGEFLGELGPGTSIQFTGGLGSVGLANSGFNNAGQLAFRIFVGGGEAIVIGQPEEAGGFAIASEITVAPQSMDIYWPAEYPGTVVESTMNIADPQSWEETGVTPVLENERYRATIPTTENWSFIRLRQAAQ